MCPNCAWQGQPPFWIQHLWGVSIKTFLSVGHNFGPVYWHSGFYLLVWRGTNAQVGWMRLEAPALAMIVLMLLFLDIVPAGLSPAKLPWPEATCSDTRPRLCSLPAPHSKMVRDGVVVLASDFPPSPSCADTYLDTSRGQVDS